MAPAQVIRFPARSSDRAEELRDLVLAITGATGPDGQPRVPPRLQPFLLACFAGRGRALPGLAHLAVRLAALVDPLHPHGYVGALNDSLPVLRSRGFMRLFGRSDPKLVLEAPHLRAAGGTAFIFDLRRAPAAAAYLDAAQAMLGYAEVRDLLAPLLRGTVSAAEVAGHLHKAVLDWLHPRLQREHLLRQARVIRGFLQGRGVGTARDIDDAVILDFWREQAPAGEGPDGFRLWRNAVRQLVAYRIALDEAATGAALDIPLSTSASDEEGGIDLARFDVAEGRADGADMAPWISPLAMLSAPGAAAVKWITAREHAVLATAFAATSPAEGTPPDPRGSSAFGDARPEPALLLTWLRFAVFGAAQARAVEAARGGAAIGLPQDIRDYAAVREDWSARHEAIAGLHLAAAWDLLRRSPADGLVLALDSLRDIVLAALRDTSNDYAAAAELVRAAPEAAELARAFRAVNRVGFRRQDAEDPAITAALREGAPWLRPLREEIAMLLDWLAVRDLATAFATDRATFAEVFMQIYGGES
ncbi:hypothetical protein [Nioella sp.]|uniref:hypothetical protein n=1 Tax=Nioella sp. TaxID=1912091 RepID=UPI003B52A354